MAACLNGCHDYDHGEDTTVPKVCTCTAEETLAAVERLNSRGYSVVFMGTDHD